MLIANRTCSIQPCHFPGNVSEIPLARSDLSDEKLSADSPGFKLSVGLNSKEIRPIYAAQ